MWRGGISGGEGLNLKEATRVASRLTASPFSVTMSAAFVFSSYVPVFSTFRRGALKVLIVLLCIKSLAGKCFLSLSLSL